MLVAPAPRLLVDQVLAARRRYGVSLPLILMNSFRTREQSLELLEAYPELRDQALPLDFLQSAEPKLDEDLAPVQWPADPSLEWCPPGHGDIYTALVGTGLACVTKDYGAGADCSLGRVEIDQEGRIAIHCDHVEMGNGIGTALADDPALTCRLPGMFECSPVRVILDARLRIPLSTAIVGTSMGNAPWPTSRSLISPA